MTAYDEIAQADADDECRAWVRNLLDARDDVVAFVDAQLNGQGTGEYLGFFKGSFNLSFHIGFGSRQPSVLIRFAKPGHTFSQWRAEKVENEVAVIQYLGEHTTIPVPRIRCWGLEGDSSWHLGPYMIMDFVEGVKLSTFLKEPNEDEDAEMVLDPAIEESTLDVVYDQLADFVYQLSRLDFDLIGAISKDAVTGTWGVVRRPLTYDMNELVTGTGFPADYLPTAPFHRASDYFYSIARQRYLHLETQRNLAKDEADVQRRFVARRGFEQLISKFCASDDDDDDGPFTLFCDDLQPSNMLIDPSSLRITAVLDFEFTNSMPAQFACDPPWWLLLRGPDVWLDRDDVGDFLRRYVPRMEQFVRAVERVEEARSMGAGADGGLGKEEGRLSVRMRESWESGRFWFHCAARTCLDMDDLYWHGLHVHGLHGGRESGGLGDERLRKEVEALTRMKMEQKRVYEEQCKSRFP